MNEHLKSLLLFIFFINVLSFEDMFIPKKFLYWFNCISILVCYIMIYM